LYDKWLKGPRKPGTFPTGSRELHQLWAELAGALEKYNFGKIFTLEPIRSNEEALARYVGKYISKHIGQREETDKGVRLINYSRNWIKNSVNRAWNTDNAKDWRKKLAVFAVQCGCTEFYQLTEKLGAGWAYKYKKDIFEITAEEIYIEKVEPTEIAEYESPELKRIYRNFELAEKEITISTDKSKSRMKSRDKARRKSKAQSLVSEVDNWLCDEVTEFLSNELKDERNEFPFRQAQQEKEALIRRMQALETIESESGYLSPKPEKTEVPF